MNPRIFRNSNRPTFQIALLCMASACVAGADTVGYWAFGDGAAGAAASSLATVTNAPGLNATAAAVGSGNAPAFDADVPGARILGNLGGPAANAANASSLRFVNTGIPDNPFSCNGGCVTVPDSPLLHAQDLTVEVYVKVDRNVYWPLIVGKARADGGGTSWDLDMDNAGHPRVRIDSQPLGTTGGEGWNQCWASPTSIGDGLWHHLAFTYSAASREVRLYVDHVLGASGNSHSNLVYDSSELRMGQGAGDMAFDGWIDEVRISDSALTPEQFLSVGEPDPVVGWWTFDDGAPGTAASALATGTNAPALNASASASGSGCAPAFDADVPGAAVRDGLGMISSAGAANAASLRFVNAGLPGNTFSWNGGCATVPDSPLLRSPDLTVEAFVRIDRKVSWPLIVGKARADGGGTSWDLDMDNAGHPRVRIDSQSLGTTGGDGFNQSWTAALPIDDGRWHHLAFTYSGTNREVRLYVDYVLGASGNSYSNLVYDSSELRMGVGAGDQAFDGWIDEVRIANRALLPREFLTVSDPGACSGYWTFGDGAAGTQAGTLMNALYAPSLRGTASAVAGGTVPVFSAETPAAETPRITDGDGGPVVNIRNSSSLRFVNAGLAGTGPVSGGGDVSIPAGQLAPLTNFTAEAFVRADRHVGYPQIIGKERKDTSGLSWSLAVNAEGNLRARFDTQTPPSSAGLNQTFESSGKVEDGKWHHVALTYDGATGMARLYLDYAKVLEGTVANPLRLDSGDIHVGSGDMAFDGWIDEVRVSDRVLAPAAFLHAAPVVGSVTAIQ